MAFRSRIIRGKPETPAETECRHVNNTPPEYQDMYVQRLHREVGKHILAVRTGKLRRSRLCVLSLYGREIIIVGSRNNTVVVRSTEHHVLVELVTKLAQSEGMCFDIWTHPGCIHQRQHICQICQGQGRPDRGSNNELILYPLGRPSAYAHA